MKEHQQEHKHKRFYLFRHVGGAQIMYLDDDANWTDEFYHSRLWINEERARNMALTCKNCSDNPPGARFVVGCVNVEVDGFYIGGVV